MNRRLHPPCLAAAALLLAAPLCAQAQASAPWFARASLSYLYEANYLRLPDSQPTPPAGYSKADGIASATLAAGFDQRFATDQRAYANAELRSSRLANNTVFDNQGWRLTGGLNWRASGSVSGDLRWVSDRSLAAFEPSVAGTIAEKNLITLSQADAVLRLGRATGLNAEASLGWREVDYSAAGFENRDFHESSAALGVRYRPSERSGIGVALRATRGSYPRYRVLAGGSFQADDYNGRFVDITGSYRATGKSELRVRLSSGRTRHENAVQSDLSGLTGSLDWRWEATTKLTLVTSLQREPSQDSYFSSNEAGARPLEFSRVSTLARLSAEYMASEFLRLRASASGAQRELSQSIPFGSGSLVVNGSDRTTVVGLGATWLPTRLLRLGCDIGREMRRGSAPLSADVTASSVGCQAQVLLEARSIQGR